MARKRKQKVFHLLIRGANVQGEVFKNGDILRVEPGLKVVDGCLACMRTGHVGNQHTWTRQVGRYFEGPRGRRTFRLLDEKRTVLDVRKEEVKAQGRGDRVDFFRIPYVVYETPHATLLSPTYFEGDNSKLYYGNPQSPKTRGKAA